MFNRKSSYALNKKDPNAIVYMDANEAIIRLTREDFASEEEFLKWKSLSDADYHASEKEDHVYANHTLALDELSEEAASIPAADICMEQAHDRVAEIRRSTQKVTQIRKHLTDTQFRRMWMYFVDGMTIDEIGKVEGVSHQAIAGTNRPYLSHSGGEKVKIALAVTLGLADVKARRAGIQLGMLFIDEPPFLDADGTEAYADALTNMAARNPGMRILAISHDPTMKARFSQNIIVSAGENGSTVSME